MEIKGWIYYNHAAIPTSLPHIDPDITSIVDKTIWKMDGGTPLLARWTTDFDCGYETNWWYVITDSPFDISQLKAKRRYEINKGRKNFTVREINPRDYINDLFEVTEVAYSSWDEKYRPVVVREDFCEGINHWNWYKVLGVFLNETNKLCGYALLSKEDNCVSFNVLRVRPEYEKMGINAVAVYSILEQHESFLSNGGYICDGERSVNHETAFQNYLEKYFCFRKAYCNLHVSYNPKIKIFVKILYLFREVLKKLDRITLVHQINAVLKMEELVRN